jgi:lactoylglutathione lyase
MHIDHIAIWTNQLERLKIFYETYFQAQAGSKYINSTKHLESYFLSFSSGARLELMHKIDIQDKQHTPRAQTTGYSHLAFAIGCEQGVNELTDRLHQDGFFVLNGPRQTGDGYYESVVLDPDGNQIEITR